MIIELDISEDEVNKFVVEMLQEQINSLEAELALPTYSYYSFDPKEERKMLKKALKAYRFVLGEFE